MSLPVRSRRAPSSTKNTVGIVDVAEWYDDDDDDDEDDDGVDDALEVEDK
jgi:hypothetical protein